MAVVYRGTQYRAVLIKPGRARPKGMIDAFAVEADFPGGDKKELRGFLARLTDKLKDECLCQSPRIQPAQVKNIDNPEEI